MTSDELHIVCYGFEKLKNHIYIHAAKNGEFMHKILVKYQGQWNFFKRTFCAGWVLDPTSLFSSDFFLYANLVVKRAPKFYKVTPCIL